MIRWIVVAAAWAMLGACSDAGEPPTTLVAADSADQVGFGVVHYITIDGVRRIKLEADTAYFYQQAQVAELIGVHIEFYSPEGVHHSTITAIEGTYDWRVQGMEARGNVVAVTPDGRKLTTEILRYNRDEDEIRGPESFIFDAPDQHLEGDAFTANTDFTRVETTRPRRGRIRGVQR